jgi:hypothetical protein
MGKYRHGCVDEEAQEKCLAYSLESKNEVGLNVQIHMELRHSCPSIENWVAPFP